MAGTSRLVDVVDFAQTLPDVPAPLVGRENILETIDRIFGGGIEVVAVEGEEGIGKTVLLYQFARRHSQRTLCLFIRPISPLAYDPNNIRFDLANQLQWMLQQTQLRPDEEVEDVDVRQKLLELHRRAKRRNETYYFVVDGLADIPAENRDSVTTLLQMLPLGLSGFKFLISGDGNRLLGKRKISIKSFPVSPFSFHESEEFLGDIVKSKAELEEIHRTWKGVPGHLASVRRIINSGADPTDLIQEMPERLKDLFEIEWSRADLSDQSTRVVLAVLAHGGRPRTCKELSELSGATEETIKEHVRNFPFLILGKETADVDFVSESFRNFASRHLGDQKVAVINLHIARLSANPQIPEALTSLPSYLEQADKHDLLLEHLSPEYFLGLLDHSKTLTSVHKQLDLGLSVSSRLNRHGELFGFSLEKSTLLNFDASDASKAEIEALVALGDYDSALLRANSAVLNEDRLHLLAVVAKARKEQGFTVEGALFDQIKQLYEQVDPQMLGAERALEVATDLFLFAPDLALSLIERATSTQDGENALDWALAQLSVATLFSKPKGADPKGIDALRSAISGPEAGKIVSAAAVLMALPSATEAISEAEKLPRAGDRLFLLRVWAAENESNLDAALVIEHALNLAISTTEYVPSADFYRELAIPLPNIADKEKLRQLINIFDGQRAVIERQGPTREYVRLQLTLAAAESTWGVSACSNRLISLYLDVIGGIEDLATKTDSLAWFVARFKSIDVSGEIERREGLFSVAQADLRKSLDQLLGASADHYYAVETVLEALSAPCPDIAYEITKKLNTEIRSEAALATFVVRMMESKSTTPDFTLALQAISEITTDSKDQAVRAFAKRVARDWKEKRGDPKFLNATFGLVENIGDPIRRCLTWLSVHEAVANTEETAPTGKLPFIETRVKEAWEAIDAAWERIEIGFRVVQSLAKSSPDAARLFVSELTVLKGEVTISSGAAARSAVWLLRLLVRTFYSLVISRIDAPQDLEVLTVYINRIPAAGGRADLWARVAYAFHLAGKHDECREVVATRVRTNIETISDRARNYKEWAIANVSPALWIAHRNTAYELIGTLGREQRDRAYRRICRYVLRKQNPDEAFENRQNQGLALTHEELKDVIEVTAHIESDLDLYTVIEAASNAAQLGREHARLTDVQVSDVADRLRKIIKEKLPSKRFIKHEGYRIISYAQVNKFAETADPSWDSLMESARGIPNLADRAHCLTYISAAMPKRKQQVKLQLLNEAKQHVVAIHSLLDKLDRYETLCDAAWGMDTVLTKALLKEAISVGKADEADREEVAGVRKKIIDLAYQIDPKLPLSLASALDDDPARRRISKQIEWRTKYLDVKKSLSDENVELKNAESMREYANAAWKALGSLNAGRTAPVHIQRIREVMKISASYPLPFAYPMVAWSIENTRLMYGKTKQAAEYIRPLNQAAVKCVSLFYGVLSGSSEKTRRISVDTVVGCAGSLTVREGNREAALDFIVSWLTDSDLAYLKICDPYFGPEDLEALQFIRRASPSCRIQILTSEKHQSQLKIPKPWDEEYRRYWRNSIADQDPPDTEVVVVGHAVTGEMPIHDRWWVTNKRGLRFGTSFNSLGKTKVSEISTLSDSEARAREEDVDLYLSRQERMYLGRRLRYYLFSL